MIVLKTCAYNFSYSLMPSFFDKAPSTLHSSLQSFNKTNVALTSILTVHTDCKIRRSFPFILVCVTLLSNEKNRSTFKPIVMCGE